ncbi:MAG: glycosyltransferase involved in cell wall biosynthesis [Glaciecola sp.]|jgi:glycosyltransferase involved in cell wall biosynthesis
MKPSDSNRERDKLNDPYKSVQKHRVKRYSLSRASLAQARSAAASESSNPQSDLGTSELPPDSLDLSFVVPVLDEIETLEALYTGIAAECYAMAMSFEIVFVDDGSKDSSWQRIKELNQLYPGQVVGIKLRKNCGKASALAVGFRASRGKIIFTMDADLQDDPREIPHFLKKLEEGHGLVCGWKQARKDPWHKVYPSRIFNRMISLASGVQLHDHNCGFKCMPSGVARQLRLYGDMHRMIPAQLGNMGYSCTEIPVTHHKRDFGVSKYGVSRFIAGFVDTLTVFYMRRFAQRPAHLLVSMAIVALSLGSALLTLGLARDLVAGEGKILLIVGPLLITVALILFSTGLLEEQMVFESFSKSWKAPIAEEVGRRGAGQGSDGTLHPVRAPRRSS